MSKKLEWVKEHKKEILVGAGTVIGTAVLITIGVKCSKSSKGKVINDMPKLKEIGRIVDEDIFTELAPSIEETVLNKGLEKVVLERSYDLGDNLSKYVTVTIENVYGD